MRFGILGALDLRTVAGTPVDPGGPRPRALLGLLLLEAGRGVRVERLTDGLYGAEPPAGAGDALQAQVSRLRRRLAPHAEIEATPAGYRLAVPPDAVDLHRFDRPAGQGRAALAAGDPVRRGPRRTARGPRPLARPGPARPPRRARRAGPARRTAAERRTGPGRSGSPDRVRRVRESDPVLRQWLPEDLRRRGPVLRPADRAAHPQPGPDAPAARLPPDGRRLHAAHREGGDRHQAPAVPRVRSHPWSTGPMPAPRANPAAIAPVT